MKLKLSILALFFLSFILTGCGKNEYIIRFLDWDESIILEVSLEEGKEIETPNEPTREGYEFIGWDQEFSVASKDIDITAQYGRLSYTVRFFDDQNNLLKEQTVFYGENATAPTVAKKQDLEFSHWDKSFTNIKENLDVVAVFKDIEYTVEFYDGTKKLSFTMNTYKPSEIVTLPIPAKEGHAFIGWFLSEKSLYEITELNNSFEGNIKLYSRWVKTEQNKLSVPNNVGEFVKINKNPHSSGNGYVYQPQFPAGAISISVTQYDWDSLNKSVATISAYSSISIVSAGYSIITATYKSDPNIVYYCVIQTSADGVVKSTIEEASAPNYVMATFKMSETETIEKVVQKGGYVIPPTAPEKEGYVFTGWVGENQETIHNITKDTIFIPTYEKGANSYAGKTISVLGDSITTYYGYIPDGFQYFYPYPTADLADVNQTWWMQFINHYGMKLLSNNAWSGSAVAGTAESAAHKPTRLEHLYIGEVKPDVILIFMGANDAASPYINVSQFDEAYGKMIANIKSVSPGSEIILCKLPSLPLYSESNQSSFNEVIQKYANLHDLKVINFSQSFTLTESSLYLVDSAHPNKDGMDKLADIAISDFWNVIK